ncbi:MAG: hypothetical protein IH914_04890 [candidate division Zixibacteria bacterium]|nr:hypothetical protein [candidate division Zixibacteria bacterium]
MMKKVSYLTAPLMILALFVFGCSQESPTAAGESEGAPKIDAPTVSGVDEVGPQLTPEAAENPNGDCCPEGFVLEIEVGNPADHNGDNHICRKDEPGGAITIDNNAPGNCVLCSDGSVPPCEL